MGRLLRGSECVEHVRSHSPESECRVDAESQPDDCPKDGRHRDAACRLDECIAIRLIQVVLDVVLGKLAEVFMLRRLAEDSERHVGLS